MTHGKLFFDTYVKPGSKIVDIGAQDVTGSLRSLAPEGQYIGVDFVEGRGIDVIITDPYSLPFEDASIDVCVSSSCFEHSEFFWLTFLETLRILKPEGLLYLNVPSNGPFHRYPVDCWRFYPDSGLALERWANRNGVGACLLESFTGLQDMDYWNDFVAVFAKDVEKAALHPRRIQDSFKRYTNGFVRGSPSFTQESALPEDHAGFLGQRTRTCLRRWGASV